MGHLKIILSFSFFLIASAINGQDANQGDRIGFKFSYTGSVISPGLRVGSELPISVISKERKLKNNRVKIIDKQRMLNLNLGWYHHPDFHDNFYLSLGWTWRRLMEKSWFIEASPALGYSRTFNGGTTYRYENGEVSKKQLAGYNYLMADIGVGGGYDFSNSGKSPIAIFSNVNFLFMLPYNSFFLLKPLWQVGIIFRPSKFSKPN